MPWLQSLHRTLQRFIKLGIIGFSRAQFWMDKLTLREDEAIQEPWAHFHFHWLQLRVPTRGTVGAHVMSEAGRSWVPAPRYPPQPQRSAGPASAPRGRCCTKLLGVPRPSARGCPPPTGWRGNGQPRGWHCCLRGGPMGGWWAGPTETGGEVVPWLGADRRCPGCWTGSPPLVRANPSSALHPRCWLHVPLLHDPQQGLRRPAWLLERGPEQSG